MRSFENVDRRNVSAFPLIKVTIAALIIASASGQASAVTVVEGNLNDGISAIYYNSSLPEGTRTAYKLEVTGATLVGASFNLFSEYIYNDFVNGVNVGGNDGFTGRGCIGTVGAADPGCDLTVGPTTARFYVTTFRSGTVYSSTPGTYTQYSFGQQALSVFADPGPNGANGGRFKLTIGDSFAVGVPEPASWALMIGGFFMVGAVTRRRKVAHAS